MDNLDWEKGGETRRLLYLSGACTSCRYIEPWSQFKKGGRLRRASKEDAIEIEGGILHSPLVSHLPVSELCPFGIRIRLNLPNMILIARPE